MPRKSRPSRGYKGHKRSKAIPIATRLNRALREVARLEKIEHAAWHLLDDSAQHVREGIIVVDQKRFDALSKLLPEDHP